VKTLVVDIGGTSVKIWMDENQKLKFPSGESLAPDEFVKQVRKRVAACTFDRVSIGYPGHVSNGHPAAEPYNLAPGWTDYDYAAAFGVPVRIMNDACMQALGSYEGGRMLYLGLGTSLGTTYIMDYQIVPLALGHLKFCGDKSFEHYLSRNGLKRDGEKRWSRSVSEAAIVLQHAFLTDYIVLGGGNAKKLRKLPAGCRRGGNHHAHFGGVRMWDDVISENSTALSVFKPAAPNQGKGEKKEIGSMSAVDDSRNKTRS
jgi:hypothetical protein